MKTTSITTISFKIFCKNMNDWWRNMEQPSELPVSSTWTVNWPYNKLDINKISRWFNKSRFRWLWINVSISYWIAMSTSHQEENAGIFQKLAHERERTLGCLVGVHVWFVFTHYKFHNKDECPEPSFLLKMKPPLCPELWLFWQEPNAVELGRWPSKNSFYFNFSLFFHQCEMCCQHKAYHDLVICVLPFWLFATSRVGELLDWAEATHRASEWSKQFAHFERRIALEFQHRWHFFALGLVNLPSWHQEYLECCLDIQLAGDTQKGNNLQFLLRPFFQIPARFVTLTLQFLQLPPPWGQEKSIFTPEAFQLRWHDLVSRSQ